MQKIERILDNHNLLYSTILTSDSGFSNKVYITDQHVVKLFTDRKRYDKEYWFYKNVSSDYTATMIASNQGEEPYIILEKINGCSLFKIWHTLNNRERKRIISRIADIVRSIHHLDAAAYNQVFHEDKNWGRSLSSNITAMSAAAKGFLSQGIYPKILHFVADHMHCLDHVPYAVNYTDLHFDNIFIDSANKLYLIDFETVEYTPIDYVLDIWVRMSRYPHLYAHKADEKNVCFHDYQNIVDLFAEYYPELFSFEGHSNRMKLYSLEYDLSLLKEYPENMNLRQRIVEDLS